MRRIGLRAGGGTGQCDGRPGKSHSPEGHSTRTESRVRGMASTGRRICAQIVERPSNSATTRTCDAKKCKDAKELKERLTAWSLKVVDHEHQFKVIDEAQKIFVVREMMPKDIKREFLTGPRKFDEIMEKLEIIINEMMADNGPVQMHLGNVSGHDTKSTQGDSDTSNDMSYEDVCAVAWKWYKTGKGAGKKGPNGLGLWHRGKGADEWTSGKRDDGGKKGGEQAISCETEVSSDVSDLYVGRFVRYECSTNGNWFEHVLQISTDMVG